MPLLRIQGPGGGELGGGVDDAGDDRRHGEIPHALRLPAEDADQAKRPERSQHRRDMAVGAGPADRDSRVERREHHPAVEGGADCVDEDGRHLREVGDGSPADALALAPCLAEEDCRRGRAVGDDIDAEGQRSDPYMAT